MNQFISNQDEIIENVIMQLTAKQPITIIAGPSGSGKTFVLEKVEQKMLPITSFWLKGDPFSSQRDYYPFYNLISQLYASRPDKLKEQIRKKQSKAIIEQAGSISPIGSEMISMAIQSAINHSKETKIFANCIFSEKELDIIFQLEYFNENQTFNIFLCDDIQYWDLRSIHFLYLLLKNIVSNNSLLKSPFFVLSITEQDDNNKKMEALYSLATQSTYKLLSVKSESYHLVLKHLGLNIEIEEQLAKALFTITNGNLQLSSDIVMLLNNSPNAIEETIETIISRKNLGHMLIERLEGIQDGVRINHALKYASLFGNTFQYLELENILGLNEGSIREIIRNAEDFSLVKKTSTNASFIHELIRKAYKDEIRIEQEKYYQKYSDCIKILYPSNYQIRKESLILAGEYEEAALISILLFIQQLRNGVSAESNQKPDLITTLCYLNEYINSMEAAYSAFNRGEYRKCYSVLDTIEIIYPNVLMAEKAYLLSVTLSKWLTDKYREEARTCLEPYLDKACINYELELWERIVSVYIVACIHDNKRIEAEKYEKILTESISKRIGYDFDASFKLNILRRKYSMIYNEAKTYVATQKSKEFFAGTNGNVLNPLQYYMSLSNYIAAALKNGNSSLIENDISQLLNLPNQYHSIHFQRMEIPLNNIIIASYINQKLSAEEAATQLEKLLNSYSLEKTTSIIIESNMAVLYCCNGDIAKGYQLISKLYSMIQSFGNLEFYYYYLIVRNLSAICYYRGERERAISFLEDILNHDNIKYRESFELQTIALLKNMKENESLDDTWYVQPLEYQYTDTEVPDFWRYYGKKYLFGELEFWSES